MSDFVEFIRRTSRGTHFTPVENKVQLADDDNSPLGIGINPLNIAPASQYLDAFGNLRTSSPVTLFDCQFTYDKQALLFDEVVVAGGSAAHNANMRAVVLTCTNAANASIKRRQHYWNRYQPGKSQKIVMTGIIGAPKVGVVQRIGYYDDSDGMYFEQSSVGMAVVLRTSVSGAVDSLTYRFAQSDWNLDKLDGTGNSGFTIDPTKANIFVIDFEALYVGKVRFGIDFGGGVTYCHQMSFNNTLTTPYIANANLPITYELTNLGSPADATTMLQICCSVISEGGFQDERGLTFGASNGATTIGVTTRRPILSIRPALTFNSLLNRGQVWPLRAEVYAQNNGAYIEMVLNGTLSGGAGVWTAADANSMVQYNIDHTGIANGIVIGAPFFAIPNGVGVNAKSSGVTNLLSKVIMSLNAAGLVPDTLSLVATSLNATATLSGIWSWKELR